MMTNPFDGVSRNKKFDIQLSNAQAEELALAEIFTHPGRIKLIEVKGESYLWEKTGNIFVEYSNNGKASGIAATEADLWVHVLKTESGEPLLYLAFPTERLKSLCRDAYAAGNTTVGGDDGLSKGVLLPIKQLLKYDRVFGDHRCQCGKYGSFSSDFGKTWTCGEHRVGETAPAS